MLPLNQRMESPTQEVPVEPKVEDNFVESNPEVTAQEPLSLRLKHLKLIPKLRQKTKKSPSNLNRKQLMNPRRRLLLKKFPLRLKLRPSQQKPHLKMLAMGWLSLMVMLLGFMF